MEYKQNQLANSANAFNIGIQNYKEKGFENFSNLSEAHADVKKVTWVMKKELFWKGDFGETVDIIDDKTTRNHLF
jgi:hypothetical protein